MSRLIFDIETVGKDLEALAQPVQDYLLRFASSDDERQEVRDSLSFYPLTAQIVAIGLFDPDTEKGSVLFQNNSDPVLPFTEEGFTYESVTEQEMLQRFWERIKDVRQFITFNGRGFDCPFVMIRSAIHRIRPSRDLMPNRYGDVHIDLFDQLTFYGASRRKFSLDMWCRAFGIKSPKDEGITGYEVKDLYNNGKYSDIARYCAGDLRATAELLSVWEKYIRVSGRK